MWFGSWRWTLITRPEEADRNVWSGGFASALLAQASRLVDRRLELTQLLERTSQRAFAFAQVRPEVADVGDAICH